MPAIHCVYVLENRAGRFYTGLSDDVAGRVEQHNAGESRWTKGRGPWGVVWQSEELSLTDARKLENRLKRQKGGHGLFHLIGVRSAALVRLIIALEAGPRVQIPPRQPNHSRRFGNDLPLLILWANCIPAIRPKN